MSQRRKSAPCLALEQDLVLFHYGELAGAERQRVQAHVSTCVTCARSLREMARLLPQTVLADEPPPDFWTGYSRELRRKLSEIKEQKSWPERLFPALRPWSLPAFAVSAVLALALSFTLAGNFWQHSTPAPPEEGLFEILPMAENLEFFRNLDALDEMDFLDQVGNPGAA
jgi:hypothetical protein